MKIAINSRLYTRPNTGIPYYIAGLYNELQKHHSENEYLFFQLNSHRNIGQTILPEGRIGSWLMKNHQKLFISAYFDSLIITHLIKGKKVDLFHGPANTLPIRKLQGVKYAVTIHDLSFLRMPSANNILFNTYWKWAVRNSLKNADVIISDSLSTKNDIIKFYTTSEAKIQVVYLGVDELFDVGKTKGNTQPLIESEYILSVTTHPRRKNIYSVLEAIATNKSLSQVRYVIVGIISPYEELLLKQKIVSLNLQNRVTIFGSASRDQLANLYQHAKVFVYPSYYEGFGLPILEAMRSRCPVITSNQSSMPELMPDRTWLINPYNIADIGEKISQILNLNPNQYSALVDKNYQFSKQFTWANTAKSMLRIFKDVTS